MDLYVNEVCQAVREGLKARKANHIIVTESIRTAWRLLERVACENPEISDGLICTDPRHVLAALEALITPKLLVLAPGARFITGWRYQGVLAGTPTQVHVTFPMSYQEGMQLSARWGTVQGMYFDHRIEPGHWMQCGLWDGEPKLLREFA